MRSRKIFNGHSRGPKPSRWKEQSQGSFESFFERLKGPQMLPADVEMEVEQEHAAVSVATVHRWLFSGDGGSELVQVEAVPGACLTNI